MSLFPAYSPDGGEERAVCTKDGGSEATAPQLSPDLTNGAIGAASATLPQQQLNDNAMLSCQEQALQRELEQLASEQESDDADALPVQDSAAALPTTDKKHKHKKDKKRKKDKKTKKKKKKEKKKKHKISKSSSSDTEKRSPSNSSSHSLSSLPCADASLQTGVPDTSLTRPDTLDEIEHKRSRSLSQDSSKSKQARSGSKRESSQRSTKSGEQPSKRSRSREQTNGTLPEAKKRRTRSRSTEKESCRRSRSHDRDHRRSKSRDKRDVSKDRSRSKSRRDKSRSKSKSRRDKSRSKDRKNRSGSKDRKNISKSIDRKSRSRSRDRKNRSRSRDRKNRSRSRDRKNRSRSRDRKNRSRSRDRKNRSRSRDRKNRSRSRDGKCRSRSRDRRDRSRDRRDRSIDRRNRLKDRRDRSRSRVRRDRRHRISRSRGKEQKSRSRSNSRSRYSRKKRQRRSRSRSRSPTSGKRRERSEKSSRKGTSGKSSRMFVELGSFAVPSSVIAMDREGDKNNLAFAMTHYTQLVRYKAMRDTLGQTPFFKKPQKKTTRYFQRKVRNLLLQDAVMCVPVHEIMDDAPAEELYVSASLTYAETLKVANSKKEQVKENYEKTSFYLDSVNISEDMSSNVVTGDETEYEYWMKQSKDYNERLSKDSKNEKLWLEFVRFQDRAFVHLFRGESKDGVSKAGKSGKSGRALADRKVALLDAAIKKNPQSVALQFERLVVGEALWELNQLNREWATLVYNFPNNMKVWHRYVSHHATCSLQFRVPSAVSASSRCCEKLRLMATGVFATHAPPPHAALCSIDVVTQVCSLWAGSGYRERAVALWQALLEFNLFLPSSAAAGPLQDRLLLMEQFWDSRAPRVGEAGSVGWAEAVRTRQSLQYTDQILEGKFDEEDKIIEAAIAKHPILASKMAAHDKADEGDSEGEQGAASEAGKTSEELQAAQLQRVEQARRAQQQRLEYESCFSELWLRLEHLRESNYWLPYAADPDDCEDPERMVAFEVLAPFVVPLPLTDEPTPTAPHTHRFTKRWQNDNCYEKFYMVIKFLEFLGVDIAEVQRNLFDYLQIDDYNWNCFEALRLESLDSLFSSDVLSVCSNYTKMLGLLPTVGPSLGDVTCDTYFQFVCNVLERTMTCFDPHYSGYLAVLYIKVMIQRYNAFQRANLKSSKLKKIEKTYKKSAKNLLKRENFRNNLLVYREYGALEECFGNFMDAEKVYITGLVMGSKNVDVFECEAETFGRVTSLCQSYLRLHLTAAAAYADADVSVHSNSVLSLLCALANDGRVLSVDTRAPSPATLLRARKKLAELLELALLTFVKSKKLTTCNNRIITVLCTFLSLVQFFTSGFKSFCLIYEDTISRIESNDNTIVKKFVSSTSDDEAEFKSKSSSNGKPIPSIRSPCIDAALPAASVALLQCLQEQYLWLCSVLPRLPTREVVSSSVPPSQYRLMLQRALHTAPDSSFLLALQANTQNWRRLVSGVGSAASSAKQLLFRVLPHLATARTMILHTGDAASVGVSHTLLSVLRGAVQRADGQHCPVLWRLYLSWSSITRSSGTAALTDTALTDCPASKAVYLSAAAASPGSGLRSVVRLMEERGLRCRLPLQELELLLLEEHDQPSHGQHEDLSSSTDSDASCAALDNA